MTRRFPFLMVCGTLWSCGQPEGGDVPEQLPDAVYGSLTLFNASDERHVVTVEFKEIYSKQACAELQADPERIQDSTFAALTSFGPYDLELFSGEEIALHYSEWSRYGYLDVSVDLACTLTLISSPHFASKAVFSESALYGSSRSYFHNRDAPEGLYPRHDSLVISPDYSGLAPGVRRQGWRAVRCPDATNEYRVEAWCEGVGVAEKARASRPPRGARYSLETWEGDGGDQGGYEPFKRTYDVWTLP